MVRFLYLTGLPSADVSPKVSSVKVRRYPDASAFLDRAAGWLLESEATHNSILGDVYLLATRDHPFSEPIYMASVEDDGRIVACAVRPPPDGLTLTAAPRGAVEPLVDDVARVFGDLPGVSGPEPEAEEFARRWSSAHDCEWHASFLWRWYALERVADVGRPPSGRLRLATEDDRELADAWADAYASAVRTRVDVRAFFERRVKTRSLYLWQDGAGPRSLVAVSGLTPATARISAVYTPPESRGNGYATAAVAEVSSRVLASGKTCVLFADRTDPTPNSIYMRIGYRPILDTVGITFVPRQ